MRGVSVATILFAVALGGLVPLAWLLGGLVEEALPAGWGTPPANAAWLRCLPESVIGTEYWNACVNKASRYGMMKSLALSSGAFIIAAILFIAGLTLAYTANSQIKRIIRGPRLYAGRAAVTKIAKHLKQKRQKPFIKLPGGIPISKEMFFRHWLMVGAVGSGKTVFIRNFIGANRHARNLILDVKGDFVSEQYWMTREGRKEEARLINPFDRRSLEWWLGSDIVDAETAREFAYKFVSKNDKDDFWSKATANLMVALLLSLRKEKGTKWSWADLAERISASKEIKLAWAKRYYPAAVEVLESGGTEAAASVLMSFATDFAAITDIARFWHKGNKAEKISLRTWLKGKDRRKMLILGWDASRDIACKSWCGAFIDLAGMQIASSTYQARRQVNFILDEFAQLPEMKGIVQILDTGRSKKVCVFIGTQSFSQLKAIYKERAESFRALIGNHLFAQLPAGRDGEIASRFVGYQYVRERNRSFTEGQNSNSASTSWVERKVPILTPDEFGSRLGPAKGGVKVLYLPLGFDVYILDVPYPKTKRIRKAFVPAVPEDALHRADASASAQIPKKQSKPKMSASDRLKDVLKQVG